MSPKVGICTDSSSQLPALLALRFGIAVVPVTVTVDEVDYLEGPDIDADSFFSHFTSGHRPVVTSTEPSPGQFAVAYEELIEHGCTEILSIHATSTMAGTINAARLAAHSTPVPVRLVDSGTAGFGTSCSVWAAADAVASGASLDEAAQVAEKLLPSIGAVFVLGAIDPLCEDRLGADPEGQTDVPVMTARDGRIEVLGRFATMVDAVDSMADYVIDWGDRLKVAVGHSDSTSAPLADALEDGIGPAANVLEVVRYRIGPSMGVHTGRGSVCCFMFPAG